MRGKWSNDEGKQPMSTPPPLNARVVVDNAAVSVTRLFSLLGVASGVHIPFSYLDKSVVFFRIWRFRRSSSLTFLRDPSKGGAHMIQDASWLCNILRFNGLFTCAEAHWLKLHRILIRLRPTPRALTFFCAARLLLFAQTLRR